MSHETVIVRTLLLPCQHTNTITFSLSLRVWHIGLFAYLLNEHLNNVSYGCKCFKILIHLILKVSLGVGIAIIHFLQRRKTWPRKVELFA